MSHLWKSTRLCGISVKSTLCHFSSSGKCRGCSSHQNSTMPRFFNPISMDTMFIPIWFFNFLIDSSDEQEPQADVRGEVWHQPWGTTGHRKQLRCRLRDASEVKDRQDLPRQDG